jgi:hypothetical protein
VIVAASQGPRTVTYAEIEDRQAARDPKVGKSFPLGELGGSPVVVVVLGDCASCSLHKADLNDLRQTGGFRVVGVYQKGAVLTNVTKDYPWLTIVEDEVGLHKELNAYVKPRAYAFNGRDQLIALQRPSEPLSSFMTRVGAQT